MPYLIDTHAHLNDGGYDNRIENIISNAEAAGVKKIISVGCDAASSLKNIEIASRHKGKIFATYGVHPHETERFTSDDTARMEMAITNREIIAVGEIGLDYYRNISPAAAQKDAFIKQLEIAVKHDFPVIIHIRDAFDDFKRMTDGVKFKGVIHCFSGDAAFARWAIERGLLISFTAAISYPLKSIYKAAAKTNAPVDELIGNARRRGEIPENMIELFNSIPPETVMVETDCPYMLPFNLRGRLERNEPAYVKDVAECLCGLMDMQYDEFCEMTSRTAERFFDIGDNAHEQR